MKIGNLLLDGQVCTAPMAGITDKAFREILARQKPALIMTEMISDQALLYENEKTHFLADLTGENYPVGIQLCGSNPAYLADAARILAQKGACLIDINMGCPAPKIVKNGEGCQIMRHPDLAAELVTAVKSVVSIPVTVKMRKGWSAEEENFLQVGKAVAKAGADAITLHGRYREQFYSGNADWEAIARLVREVPVPVIGNGDIFAPQDAQKMLMETGCAGIMIGRGMLGNPWLVGDTVTFLQDGKMPVNRRQQELFLTMRNHLQRHVQLWGEKKGIPQMRKHLAWYVKGLPKAAQFRQELNNQTSLQEVLILLANYEEELAKRRPHT